MVVFVDKCNDFFNYEFVTLIVAVVSLFVSIVSLIVVIRQNNSENRKRKTEMEANYYSLPMIVKEYVSKIILYNDKMFSLNTIKDNQNVLIEKNINSDNYRFFEISLELKNLSDIYPSFVYINSLDIWYDNKVVYANEKGAFHPIILEALNDSRGDVYINANGNIQYSVLCVVSEEEFNSIASKLKTDEFIHLSFKAKYVNSFNVFTTTTNHIKMNKENYEKKGNKNFLGSNKDVHTYSTSIEQVYVDKIEYEEKF